MMLEFIPCSIKCCSTHFSSAFVLNLYFFFCLKLLFKGFFSYDSLPWRQKIYLVGFPSQRSRNVWIFSYPTTKSKCYCMLSKVFVITSLGIASNRKKIPLVLPTSVYTLQHLILNTNMHNQNVFGTFFKYTALVNLIGIFDYG